MSKIAIHTPNGVEVRDMTSEEISQRETDTANYQTSKQEFEKQEQAQKDLKASAKAKLIAGEALTEDEANTIVI